MLTSDGTDRWVNARLHPNITQASPQGLPSQRVFFILYYVSFALVWMRSSSSVFQVDFLKDTFKMRDLLSNFVPKNTSGKLGIVGFQG